MKKFSLRSKLASNAQAVLVVVVVVETGVAESGAVAREVVVVGDADVVARMVIPLQVHLPLTWTTRPHSPHSHRGVVRV